MNNLEQRLNKFFQATGLQEIAPKPSKVIQLRDVTHKPRRNYQGISDKPTGMHADVVRNESIRIHGVYSGRAYDITFRMGETAEYDSYNLNYLGKIVSITDKNVTIQPRFGGGLRRLDLYKFSWRNYNFNLERILAKNAETSMHI